MDIELRAAQRIAPHVVAATADTDLTRLHIRLGPVPARYTWVVVGAAAVGPVLGAADRVGRHQAPLWRTRQPRYEHLRQSAAVLRPERLPLIPVMCFFVTLGMTEQELPNNCMICLNHWL